MSSIDNDDSKLQKRLRNDDKKALEEVYLENRNYVMKFFSDYKSIKTQLEDIYQDSIIDLYQNFVSRQLQLERGNIRYYLLTIVKRKIYATLKIQGRESLLSQESEQEATYEILDSETTTKEKELLSIHYKQLGQKCQQLLKLFYYRGLSIKEIKEAANYKDDNTVKSSKSRCLKQLRTMINQSQYGIE
ncbi:MAG: sigma-70 family RNA polymerase sigma factor [Bacteroidetes bacterium]|jgi:RNA polymerase sigma-70 factor (ECF subfamily)|nr:sigma-70 family RNA polymerase sigma factor [Bacteroidota bacterium]